MYRTFSMLLILVFGTVFASPPTVPVSLTVIRGELSRLEIDTKGSALTYKATAEDSELFVDELVQKGDKLRLVLQGKRDGVYHIAFTNSEQDIVFTKIIVITLAPVPVPVPTPVPVPVPVPVPEPKPVPVPEPKPVPDEDKSKPVPLVPSNLKAYLITESADKNAAYAKIVHGKTVSEYWKSRGFGAIVIADPNTIDPVTKQTPETLKPYIKQAKGLPDQLYLVDVSTGILYYQGNAPQTAESLLKILQGIK